MADILAHSTDDERSIIVLSSGRPGYVIIVREWATEGGYDIEASHEPEGNILEFFNE